MKNLVVFDLETTGLDKAKDQIIQFAAMKIDRETHEAVDTINIYVQPVKPYNISIQAYLKHGIKPEFLEDKPFIKDVAQDIINFFENCDILTFNGINFDIPFLKNELNKYGYDIDFTQFNCYDSFIEECRRNANNLGSTFKRYTGKSMEDAGLKSHDAFSDVKATYDVFRHQNDQSEVKPEAMYGEDNLIVMKDFQGELQPCFSMGKHKGLSLEFVWKFDKNYFMWAVSDKAKFVKSTKNYLLKFIKIHEQ